MSRKSNMGEEKAMSEKANFTDNHLKSSFNFFSQVYDFKQVLCKVGEIARWPVGKPANTNLYTDSAQTSDTTPCLSIVSGRVSHPFVERVLARLSEAELKARLGDRDDIRVAWITLHKADEGHQTPFAQAFFQYFSASPEKLIPFFSARADLNRMYGEDTMAVLDSYFPLRYTHEWQETVELIHDKLRKLPLPAVSLPPKKSPHSVPATKERKAA